ncbi:AzlC family ABC transporter permease [Pararhizobium haloflavum]|uniref:AzlC family ABC transporter permease n=1 Tax=Pararhizobium haloflavum TaxID=2037914 RepID=UPI000C175D4E|nr:AzlC family ABC transporter permease [Pararhizobium haloflavum]
MPDSSPPETPVPHYRSLSAAGWYLHGVRTAISIPAVILASTFVGFAALAISAGMSVEHAVFMTGMIWALPGKVVLIGAINAGNGVLSAAFAVALSSMRLTPMVVALMPEMRTPRSRNWVLCLASHFVAVTAWVLAMEKMHVVPPERRTLWFIGLGSTLIFINMVVVALVYFLAADLPDVLSAALLLLTPLYFVTSLWGSARERAGHVAMVAGILLWPLVHLVLPEFSLLATGVLGGGLAYGYHRHVRVRGKAAT